MKHNWKVSYHREGEPGTEISFRKAFSWAHRNHQALAAYVCEEGLVLDFCTEIPREEEQRFLDKWTPLIARGLTRKEEQLLRQENPLNTWHHCNVWVNGEIIQTQHANGSYWIPPQLQTEQEPLDDRAKARLEYYDLDPQQVWSFRRVFCAWTEAKPEVITSLEVNLIPEITEIHGESFSMQRIGEERTIRHPKTGQAYLLTVLDIQKNSIPIPESFAEYDMPSQATLMHYRLEPNLRRDQFQLVDCREQDPARRKDGTLYNGGCVGMMLRIPKDGTHMAASSMRFVAPDTVEWEPVFCQKLFDDRTVTLL